MNHDDSHSNDDNNSGQDHACGPDWMNGPTLLIHPDEYALTPSVIAYEDGTNEEGVTIGLLDANNPVFRVGETPIPVVIPMNDRDAACLAVRVSVAVGFEAIERAFIELRQLRSQAEGKTPESAEVIRAEMVEHIRQVAADAERDRQANDGFDFGGFGL